MSAMKKVVLLDVDGTLVDSNDAHAMAWVEALEAFGHDVAFERVRELIGKGGDKLLPEAVGIEKDSGEGGEIAKKRSELFKQKYLQLVTPFEGARSLLLELRDRGYRLVVATSATKDQIGDLLDVGHVRDLVDDVRSAEDAGASKPDPDIVVAALAAAHCSPSAAVMLGDTPYDVQAAKNANVVTVAVRCGGWDDESLEGAEAIYDDPRDLLDHFETSPFTRLGAARRG
jgi:HAD superfamily hydrolase (TIGR01509 family)